MSDPAYQRYREALREGHLAALGGQVEDALAAYDRAAQLAPGRPLPHVGLGSVHARAGHYAEALAAYDRALGLAPLDESALRGRGRALVALGRTADAATTLTGLAESLEADGRAAEALELSREALALASSPARFRLVARLSGAVRAAGAMHSGEGAAARPPEAAVSDGPPVGSATEVTAVDALRLVIEGDDLVDAGRLDEAQTRYLGAAREHQRAGRLLAALDACDHALTVAPADPDLHLALAEIYDERGWAGAAVDKLVLLARLLELQGDRDARDRLCSIVAARFAGEPRLARVCP